MSDFQVKGKENDISNSYTVKSDTDYSGIEIKGGKPKKKKKKGMNGVAKFFIIFFSVILGIPVLLVGVVYACFYDGSHKEIPIQEGYDTEQMFNDMIVDSMDDAVEDEAVAMTVTDFQINQILHQSISGNPEVGQFIKNLYVDSTNSQIQIVLEANIFDVFKTRLLVTASFAQENVNEEKVITFRITDIKLGRIGGLQKFIPQLKSFITLPDISSMFADMGFHMNVDLDNLKITYPLQTLCDDILEKFPDVGGSNNAFMQLVQDILKLQTFMHVKQIYGPSNGEMFGIGMNIADLRMTSDTHGIQDYVMPEGYFGDKLTTVIEKTIGLLNSEKIEADEDEIYLVTKYIMGGDLLLETQDEKDRINELKNAHVFDFGDITIPLYDYNLPNEKKLLNVMENKIVVPESMDPVTVTLTTTEINDSLTTVPATGVIFPFFRNQAYDGTLDYKLNYTCTDRIGVLVNNNKLFITINLCINGCPAHLSLECPRDDSITGFGKLGFSMGAFRLGDIETSGDVKDDYLSIIKSALTGEGFSGVITCDDVNNKIIVDISSILEDKLITSDLVDVTFDLVGDTATTAGGISITMTPKTI